MVDVSNEPLICNKCDEPVKEGEVLLVLIEARGFKDGTDYSFKSTEAGIHSCCDDGISLTMPADAGTWLGDPESACGHMKRKFDIP